MNRELHLNIFVSGVGHHEAAWRTEHVDAQAHCDIEFYVDVAQTAERGKFDALFLGDVPGLKYDPERRPWETIEPLVLLGALAVSTRHLGLVATASTTFEHPYSLARRFASLDKLSRGRAAWNLVTTGVESAARNFGYTEMPSIADRYDRGEEFLQVVLGLWRGTAPDAVIADKERGVYSDVSRMKPLDHVGKYYSVAGPLDCIPSEQGWPVIVQAGASGPGMDFAAKHAEVIFTAQAELEDARTFYEAIKKAARSHDRDADRIAIMPGLMPILGSTEAEAVRLQGEFNERINLDLLVRQLADMTGLPVEELRLDAPLPDNVRSPEENQGIRSRYELLLKMARTESLTVRELLVRYGQSKAHRTFVGTPEGMADLIETWFSTHAADGFNLMPAALPSGLDVFVDEVVPILQRRGLFRREYSSSTMRGHFGLPVPGQVLQGAGERA